MARFLIKMNSGLGMSLTGNVSTIGNGRFTLTQLMPHSRRTAEMLGIAGTEDWFLAAIEGDVDPCDAWDECHARVAGENAMGLASGAITYAEPDIIQPFVTDDGRLPKAMAAPEALVPKEQYWMPESSIPHGDHFDWHLDAEFSGLRAASASLADDKWRVRIGHLDTGYTDGHKLLPEHLELSLQRSFVSGDNARSAIDPFQAGLMKNPGHGTGTLGLLAGGRLTGLSFPDQNRPDEDYLGGARHATIIPVRIAPSVVLLYTSAFAQGLDYLLAPDGDLSKRVDVVSMSMGGLASAAWTDIVNRAYEAGVVLCAAAGNHYGDMPPNNIVYPARYKRVIAVCGVMEDGRPYADLPLNIMCGSYGPQSKMTTAVAAYSPNLPWALYDDKGAFRWDGQGTSAATPQVAAAAALYIEKNYDSLRAIEKGWVRVEAVRNALFSAARKSGRSGIDPRLGHGILDAMAALSVPIADEKKLAYLAPDSATFPFLRVLTGLGFEGTSSQMLHVEVLQLTQQHKFLQSIIPDPDAADPTPDKQIRAFLSAITAIPAASKHLKAALSNYLKASSVNVLQSPSSNGWTPPTPPCRKLRGYVFDPSMSTKLRYVDVSETTYKVRWEHGLKTGRDNLVGEYLDIEDKEHVVVDLNLSHILAQDGLEPSEGSPQFRQQMIYAVGMQTIDVFESALGRLVNWAPNEEKGFSKQLRLLPHGIQAPNAFYSPKDKTIYFGYFRASEMTGSGYPGMVYTALSHDIIAHEMTHALLDGMHEAFREPSNPDVLAFHEAFADIVALFQQFSNVDLVRSQSAAVRGDLSMQNLLGNLASQFGDATKGRSALRSAYLSFDESGKVTRIEPDRTKLRSATEAHERGALLVASVYRAFLAIYENRTLDLYRIASGGGSDAPLKILAPDMVNRLAEEAAHAAKHVLKMCIRAIDYCPPVDITFGDFLRAIITADVDVVPDDPLHYRVAFIESFRAWGIYPDGLEALSTETLIWPGIQLPTANVLDPILILLRKYAALQSGSTNREQLFDSTRKCSNKLRAMLTRLVSDKQDVSGIAAALGLDGGIPIEITRLRFSHKVSPAGNLRPRVLIAICQTSGADPAGVPIRWGVTLTMDLATEKVLYSILKSRRIIEDERSARHLGQVGSSTYSKLALTEPFMLLHQN